MTSNVISNRLLDLCLSRQRGNRIKGIRLEEGKVLWILHAYTAARLKPIWPAGGVIGNTQEVASLDQLSETKRVPSGTPAVRIADLLELLNIFLGLKRPQMLIRVIADVCVLRALKDRSP